MYIKVIQKEKGVESGEMKSGEIGEGRKL